MSVKVRHRLRRAVGGVRRRAGDALRTPEQLPTYVGITRFSVFRPGSGAWKLNRNTEDPEEYRRLLWSPERMRPRCDIFLTLTVPLLQRMADRHDYRHIVVYNNELPDPWRSELLAAAERYPVLHLHENQLGTDLKPAVHGLVKGFGGRSRTVVQFRLDDDDVLAVDFLDRISSFTGAGDRGRSVSLASGYSAHYHDGGLGSVHAVRRVFGAQGLAAVGSYDSRTDQVRIKISAQHTKVAQVMPTIVDSRAPAFFQMRHTGQDMLSDSDEAVRQIEADLARLTTVTKLGPVKKAFPTLAPLLR